MRAAPKLDLEVLRASQDHLQKSLHAEQARPDIAAARAELQAEQAGLDVRRLIFIDETAVTTKMVRAYGHCPRAMNYSDLWNTDKIEDRKAHGPNPVRTPAAAPKS